MHLTTQQSLALWHAVTLDQVLDEKPDLSVRQLAILLIIYMEAPPHTVRGLAKRLNVTKPVITRALDSMGQKSLVKRKRDEADKRNVLVQRTVEGSQFLEHLAQTIMTRAEGI